MSERAGNGSINGRSERAAFNATMIGGPAPAVPLADDPAAVAVACRQVAFSYGGGKVVLRDASFDVAHGAFVGVVGPNGCGKSTLLRLLLGLLMPTTGTVQLLGRSPREAVRTGEIGYVPQRETFDRGFPLTVYDVVLMGRSGRRGAGRRYRRADHRAVHEALDRIGIGGWAKRLFGELSGGQQRLTLLARALAQQPRLLVLDEADTGLDARRRVEIYHLLDDVRREMGLSVLVVSHQLELLAEVVDRAVALQDGRTIEWCADCMHHAVGAPPPSHLTAAVGGAR